MKKSSLLLCVLCTPLVSLAAETSFHNYDGFLSIGTQSNRSASIALHDIDKDGDLDALVANGRHWAEQNYIYFNDGRSGFKTGRRVGEWLDSSYGIASGDLDGDGLNDLAVVNDKTPNRIYLGTVDGGFTESVTFGNPDFAFAEFADCGHRQ